MEAQGTRFDAIILVGGQRKGGSLRLFLVYSAGNFIEATDDNPFFRSASTNMANLSSTG